MESTSKVWKSDKQSVKKELPIEDNDNTAYNSPVTVTILSKVDALVKYYGKVTGTLYVWPRAGSTQTVDARDKDEILNKKRGRACCGGQAGTALFEIV